MRINTDHRNLAYIFEPEACVSLVPKTAAQRLENWKMVLAQYDYAMMHISGERSCWGDLLSRWVNQCPGGGRAACRGVREQCTGWDNAVEECIYEVQQQARAGLSAMVSGASSFTTPVGRATKDNEDYFAWGWTVETCCGSRNKRRKYRRGS